jgi:hypothetical protein
MNRRAPTLPVRWPMLAGLVAAGVLLGLGTAWLSLKNASAFGAASGAWRVSLLAGSAEADLYTRAQVAIGGLLALNREETMYYVAERDSAGRPLRSRCSYRISGTPPSARWWSLTAYADDYFLFEDAQHRYSVNGARARLDAQGRFELVTGPAAPAAPGIAWLPTPGDRGLVLTLRVYNPDAALQAAPASLRPPRIESTGACP